MRGGFLFHRGLLVLNQNIQQALNLIVLLHQLPLQVVFVLVLRSLILVLLFEIGRA